MVANSKFRCAGLGPAGYMVLFDRVFFCCLILENCVIGQVVRGAYYPCGVFSMVLVVQGAMSGYEWDGCDH